MSGLLHICDTGAGGSDCSSDIFQVSFFFMLVTSIWTNVMVLNFLLISSFVDKSFNWKILESTVFEFYSV